MYKRKPFPSQNKINEVANRFATMFKDHPFEKEDLNKDFIVNGTTHKLLGMTLSKKFLILDEKTPQCYIADSETILNGGNINSKQTNKMTKVNQEPKMPINVKPVKMNDIHFDPSIFKPLTTGTPIDKMFSTKGGIFPATNYMVIGDPGIGKSTLTLDILSNIKRNHDNAKVLFISGEMTRIDMYDYVQRYPKFGDIDTIFLGEYLDENPKAIIETIFNEGYDLILTDSFVEVQEAVKESNHMTSKGSEKWLIDLMIRHNQGENKRKIFTSFLMIQQVTKGGNFVGSNKLKHNTTGMMEIRYSNEFSGDRYIKFTKNRRGCEYDKLYFALDKAEDVYFDLDRLNRDIDIKERLSNEKDQLLKEEDLFNKMFSQEENEIAEKRLANQEA